MTNFTYARAETSGQALTLISTTPNAKFLGGGTNLVDLMRENIEQPDALIDVTRLPSAGIAETADGGVSIGAEVNNTVDNARTSNKQDPQIRKTAMGYYAQDTWKFNRKLTLD